MGKHYDVVIVGAGLSGIGAAFHLQRSSPSVSFTVLEARDTIGGTWDLFRYPGVRSDSDMYTFGYPFRPWDDKSSIGEGEDIKNYIVDTAVESQIDEKIQFGCNVVAANWSSSDAQWTLTVGDVDGVERSTVTCGFLFGCTGYFRYSEGYTPQFLGVDTFEGVVAHPQLWPEDLDYSDSKVVVIGSGATAVTLVPAMAETARKVTMLQRSPSYVLSLPRVSPLSETIRFLLPKKLAARINRRMNAAVAQLGSSWATRYPTFARKILMFLAKLQLPRGFDVETHFGPTYDPWDQRVCVAPNGDLFAAIRSGSAEVVTDEVERFTPAGLRLSSGQELEADIIVTATGLELAFLGDMDFSVDGELVDVRSRLMFKGMMLEDVPNFVTATGYSNASWTLKSDLIGEYVPRLLNEMREHGYRVCTPRNRGENLRSADPMMRLSSGYIKRGDGALPRQGAEGVWKVRQSYTEDRRLIMKDPLFSDELEFS